MFVVYFISNVTHERKAVEIFSRHIQAVYYCEKNSFRVNSRYITPRGCYVIERKDI